MPYFFIVKAGVCCTQTLMHSELKSPLWQDDNQASARAVRGCFVQLVRSGRCVPHFANNLAACPRQLSILDLTGAFDKSYGQKERWKTLSRVFSSQDTQHNGDKGHVREKFLQKLL